MARLSIAGPEQYESQEELTVRIVSRQPPERFPVLMWGVGSPEGVLKEMERLKEVGFNHVLGLGADDEKIWEAGQPTAAAEPETVAETKHMLDEALANDMTIVASLSPGRFLAEKPKFQRVDRQGRPQQTKLHDVCGLIPNVKDFCYNVGASVAQTYGHFPAFGAAMLHTEVRDHADVCFHAARSGSLSQGVGHRRAAARRAAAGDCLIERSPVFPPTASSRTTTRCTSSIAGTGSRATAGTA